MKKIYTCKISKAYENFIDVEVRFGDLKFITSINNYSLVKCSYKNLRKGTFIQVPEELIFSKVPRHAPRHEVKNG